MPAVTEARDPGGVTLRFRVPGGERMEFVDQCAGFSGRSPGPSLVISWFGGRHDIPAYQLAVVTDDAAMQITEVVRGADLLRSTFANCFCFARSNLQRPSSIIARWLRIR